MHNENFLVHTLHQISNDQIKDNEMSGACKTHGANENCVKILVGKLQGIGHSNDLDIDGRIILK